MNPWPAGDAPVEVILDLVRRAKAVECQQHGS